MNRFEWVYTGVSPNTAEIIRFADSIGKSPVIAALAAARGVRSGEAFEKFNKKSPADLHDPFLMKDMDKAVQRIRLAIENGEHITVYGDYDVDGITSVSVLVSYLRSLGGMCDYYIPDRLDEGYGINTGALCSLFEGGTTLVITVDTGITACKEIETAKGMGMDVIVTDHHRCKEELPPAVAVVNPTRSDCDYPFKYLAGVGVVFKLVCAIEGNQQAILDRFGDIVALGTVADVVDLQGENRIIVDYGLRLMQNTKNVGLSTLARVAGLSDNPLSVSAIGYGLAPKINAAGRIGDASHGVRLFLAGDKAEAEEISVSLIEENRRRQELERKIYEEVSAKIDADPSFAHKPVLVVWGRGWHHGVIGIVSSKISEKYSKPCILITIEENVAKGSGRSMPGFNLFEAMSAFPDIFIKYGGHALAAGLTLYTDNLKRLDEAMNAYAEGFLPPAGKKQVLSLDFELPSRFINTVLAGELDLLEPCGTGNPQPVFSICGCKLVNAKQLSEGKHLRLTLEKEDKRIDAIGFGMGPDYEMLVPGDIIDVAGNLNINHWNGNCRVQFQLQDLRYTPYEGEVNPVPEREDFATVYTLLRKMNSNGFCRINKEFFLHRINLMSGGFDAEKLEVCLRIFAELGLLTFVEEENCYHVYISKTDRKVDLGASRILKNLKEKQVN